MSKDVYIGELNVRITILQITKSTSSTGEKTNVESDYKTCWARVDTISGSEESEGKIRMLDVRSYTVRYDANLIGSGATTKFITDGTEKFNIHSVESIGRKRYLKLKCSRSE